MYEACTNLEAVHLALHCSAQAIDVLSLMRTKLASLRLHDLHALPSLDYLPDPYGQRNPMTTEDRFFSVLSTCSVLKKVELTIRVQNMVPEARLRNLSESLKSMTSLTCVVDLRSLNRPRDVINPMACNLRNLESLTIWTEFLKGKDVKALVDLPLLKSVTLRPARHNTSISRHPEKCAVKVVKRFRHCAQLVQLEILGACIKNWAPLVAEAATYARRDFDIFIGGTQYRTW